GEGLPALLGRLADMVDEVVREAPERDSYVLHRPADEGYRVSRRNGAYVVEGRTVERVVAMADLTNPDAASYVRERLRRMGVEDALRSAGITDGDDVTIGRLSFEWQDDEVGEGAKRP